MSGAELPVTIRGPSSGIVRSNLGSRPRNVKVGGNNLRNSSTTARGNLYKLRLVVNAATMLLEDRASLFMAHEKPDVFKNLQRSGVDALNLFLRQKSGKGFHSDRSPT